ncbi:MAG TPA: MoaD/ThiS family protein [Thermodesulfobacteriota bacterium]|nr:MoaD/ThiS family protein [Thermodesulfobacteriota bacterium]
MVTVRFFAMLKKFAGAETREFDVKAPLTLEEFKEVLKKEVPGLSAVLDGRSLLISVNQEFAGKGAVIKDGDEVALLPPFSGG